MKSLQSTCETSIPLPSNTTSATKHLIFYKISLHLPSFIHEFGTLPSSSSTFPRNTTLANWTDFKISFLRIQTQVYYTLSGNGVIISYEILPNPAHFYVTQHTSSGNEHIGIGRTLTEPSMRVEH